MQILYGYSNCTERLFNKIAIDSGIAVLVPDQKYHNLLIKGLAKNGASVYCMSGLPINRTVTKKILIKEADEQEEQVKYHYYTTINLPLLRQLTIFCAAFYNTLKTKKDADTYAICDIQNISNAMGMALACKIKKLSFVTIVMDLPDMFEGRKLLNKLNNSLFGLSNGYVLLTEQMNAAINKKNKPYVIVEGIADSATKVSSAEKQKAVLYAGSIARQYGISNLVEGLISAKIPDIELWIYGDGDYREELEQICKLHKEIIYKGVCSNEEVVEAEKKALLLVNPRPSEPEYTKYSFPSKTMEYMASGTAVLTTKLPGIPQEYNEYLHFIEDESPEGIADALIEALTKCKPELRTCVDDAQRYVLSQKNEIVQAGKVIDLLERI